MPPSSRPPQERLQTVRAALRRALGEGPATAQELSRLASIPEKEVAHHLEHLARTLQREGSGLVVSPATCIACGFAFRERTRLTKPGSCPQCGSTRIDPPVFSLET